MDGGISCFSAVITELKAKYGFKSAQIDVPLESADVRIEVSHILRINENEGIFGIKSKSQNIFSILSG